ncbi:MAG TPA: histidine phosphatase family protein [Acidimicrobiales bacterium]|nr:histidine phosphatase family protein [Acidimicrobiales bacterium]
MLILVRHGESDANARGLLLGRTDATLTERGRIQAAAARALVAEPVRELVSSPLGRARDTAALLGLDLPVRVDERWIEVDYGAYECQPLGDVPADVWTQWRADPTFRPPQGETLAEVYSRVSAACEELFATEGGGARSPDGDVVVVSHVTPIKAAVAWALGADASLSWRLYLATASVTCIGWGRGCPVLRAFNAVVPEVVVAPHSSDA